MANDKKSLDLNRETLKALLPAQAFHVLGAGLPAPSVKTGHCENPVPLAKG